MKAIATNKGFQNSAVFICGRGRLRIETWASALEWCLWVLVWRDIKYAVRETIDPEDV